MKASSRDSGYAALLVAAFALVGPATIAVAADGASSARIQPGQYRVTQTTLELVNPALSAEQIAARKAKPVSVEYCVRDGDLRALIVGKSGALCQNELKFGSGAFSGTLSCTTGLGKSDGTIQGTFTPTRVEYTKQIHQPLPSGATTTKTHVVNERIGDCKPGS